MGQTESKSDLKKNIVKFVQGTTSESDWLEYVENNKHEWLCENGLQMLLTESEWKEFNFNDFTRVISYFITESSVSSCEPLIEKEITAFTKKISSVEDPQVRQFKATKIPRSKSCPTVRSNKTRVKTEKQDQLNWQMEPSHDWNKDRHLCTIIYFIINRYSYLLSFETKKIISVYFSKLLPKCNDTEVLLWALVIVEKLCLKNEELSTEQRNILTELLFDSLINIENKNSINQVFNKFQVGLFAKFCVKKLYFSEVLNNDLSKLPDSIKNEISGNSSTASFYFSPFCFPVTSQTKFISFRSEFGVTSGVYFYEVTILTDGQMRFGWMSSLANLNESNGLGDDDHSIGFDTTNERISYNGFFVREPSKRIPKSTWRVGNVIGCLIDMNKKQFTFYLNGHAIDYSMKTLPSVILYAAASMSSEQQCYFNFGQDEFRYKPAKIRFNTFAQHSSKYELIKPIKIAAYYSFIERDASFNSRDLFHNDRKVSNRNCPVYIQKVIETADSNLMNVHFDILENLEESSKRHIYEVMYPYLQLNIIKSSDENKHCFICLVLMVIIQCCFHKKYLFIEPIRNEIFTYLLRTLVKTDNLHTRLYIIIGLKDLQLNENEINEIKNSRQINDLFNDWIQNYDQLYLNVEKIIQPNYEKLLYLHYELYFCLKHFLSHVLDFSMFQQSCPQLKDFPTLSPFDKSHSLKLSPCFLSARSDWHWQSVRTPYSVESGIYYYEVVLLTSGRISIGWATRETDFQKNIIGDDDFSIGIDGSGPCLRNGKQRVDVCQVDQKKFSVKNINKFDRVLNLSDYKVKRWQEGDVIGCMINLSQEELKENGKMFYFFHNGDLLHYKLLIHYPSGPFYAAASLATHQQCYFNFGQTAFRHPPKEIQYSTFYKMFKEHSNYLTKQKPLSGIQMNNNNFNYSHVNFLCSNVNQGDITIQQEHS